MPRYIDADALISKIAFHRDSLKPYNVVAVSVCDAVIGFIKRRPIVSADEVRGKGKWVDKGVRAWSCSCCGTPLNHIRQFASFEKNELPNYCPNCGAKMKGAEDETTD